MEPEQPAGQSFEWHQPKMLHRFHQLSSNGQTVGSLRFEKNSGSLATGEYGSSQWTFKRTGFLHPRILIREAASETDLAIFTPVFSGGGSVTFTSGQTYLLKHTNFWRTHWAFETTDASPAVTLTGPTGGFHQSGVSTVSAAFANSPDSPILLLLIWYIRLLMNEDGAAAATIAVTV